MLINAHAHQIFSTEVITICNISINNQALSLPHGPNIRFTAGIHPWDAGAYEEKWMENLAILMTFRQMVGIGECGLDKYAMASEEIQTGIFIKQIELASILKKPLIIHCVGFYNELIQIFRTNPFSFPKIIHGFRGKPELAQQLLREGFHLSFGPQFNAASVAVTPVDRILIETDESEADLSVVYAQIAEIKQCDIDDFSAPGLIFGK
jgi:TatD DNase family protein